MLQSYQNTLMAELERWNKQEQKFKQLFGDASVKDRDFQKMKLAEYDRLWYKYQDSTATTDERSMLVMLRFQRRKLEQALYPGLITRMVRRAFVALKASFSRDKVKVSDAPGPQQYAYRSIPVESPELRSQAREHTNRHRLGQDLGKRNKHAPGQARHHSL